MIRVVHYINQFFAGLGGEEMASAQPEARDGAVGPGVALQASLGPGAKIVGTVVCGDGYYGEHTDDARERCLALIMEMKPDILIAGPAFGAGRYGFACGDVAASLSERFGITAAACMHAENPGVALFAKKVHIVPCAPSARGMAQAARDAASFALRLFAGEVNGPARLEGYLPRGMRRNFHREESGAERAVGMLLARLRGEPFQTEYEMPSFGRIAPAPPVKDLAGAKIALVSSGGLVPVGNPDRIRVSSAENYGAYDISGLDDLTPDLYESIHGGYERAYASRDPDVIVPLDVMRELERESVFGSLHNTFYTTTGTGTAVSFAERFGREIGEDLKKANVDAVILTST